MLAHLSAWMAERGLVVQQLAPVVIEVFLRSRRKFHTNLLTPRALDPFLSFLHSQGLLVVS